MNQITTERLLLRPMQLDDAPFLFEFWSDPMVSKHMNIETFRDVSQAEQMIGLLQGLSKENKAIRWTILSRLSNEIIGSCGFNYLDYENERAEIGYDLGYPYWGKGYAPEALRAIIRFGFEHYRLNRVEAKVEPENLNSIKVLKKLRFVEEGTLRQYEKSKGEFVDLLMFSLLRSDWTEE
ncbi:GNAT family N-acetyltransferase [Brevibacillus ruminantium]|uniref:GNAT family N-acetyltransferase n=1 Tax=Brevibacillus ruminantium TaxID=2950604 RepID=A0ABY4WLY8_9BACL|nr:GNAT family protein [Brevibacillus ruminantium]USG68157.1 GNAT family N-acetyltransferase [Brevibacillus ruminantium]